MKIFRFERTPIEKTEEEIKKLKEQGWLFFPINFLGEPILVARKNHYIVDYGESTIAEALESGDLFLCEEGHNVGSFADYYIGNGGFVEPV